MITNNELAHITSLIMSAAIDHSRWNQVLEELHRLSGGVRPFLIGHDQGTGYVLNAMGAGFDESYIRSFQEHYGVLNPWAEGFFAADPNIYLNGDEMCDRRTVEKSEFYNDWIRPQEDIVGGGGLLLFKQTDRVFALGGQIRRADIEILDKRWQHIIELISPHLMQAIEINRQLSGKNLENWVLSSTPWGTQAAILVINVLGKLIYCSKLGEMVLEKHHITGVDAKRRVFFRDASAQTLLVNTLKSLNTFGSVVPKTVTIESSYTKTSYTARLGSINPDKFSTSPLGFVSGLNEPVLLITISAIKNIQSVAPLLMSEFGLTGTEAQTVVQIANGSNLSEISGQRKVSIHTVRNQLKSSMRKMGVNRQVDMVLMIENIRQERFQFF